MTELYIHLFHRSCKVRYLNHVPGCCLAQPLWCSSPAPSTWSVKQENKFSLAVSISAVCSQLQQFSWWWHSELSLVQLYIPCTEKVLTCNETSATMKQWSFTSHHPLHCTGKNDLLGNTNTSNFFPGLFIFLRLHNFRGPVNYDAGPTNHL